jgi:hypothetical protein
MGIGLHKFQQPKKPTPRDAELAGIKTGTAFCFPLYQNVQRINQF